ncbi:seminase-like [Drosophila busckii]|uniref:seminase-like n=1 Tax=Drosophila busckii TaxID=30019 RepID=UPI00083EC26D|nr:seminase-like [Drosophila busckii]
MILKVESRLYKLNVRKLTKKAKRSWNGDKFNGWVVRITEFSGPFACCGSYVSPLIVLSSANCLHEHRPVLSGGAVESVTLYGNEKNNFAFIEFIYLPHNFVKNSNYMDIGVVQLMKPVPGKRVEFIKLCSSSLNAPMPMRSYAWGYDSQRIAPISMDIRNGTVHLLEHSNCVDQYKQYINIRISSTAMCVQQPKNRLDCLYDAGCPLVDSNELCGIVSLGPSCEDTSNPGIYTKIADVRLFIDEVESAAMMDDAKQRIVPKIPFVRFCMRNLNKTKLFI